MAMVQRLHCLLAKNIEATTYAFLCGLGARLQQFESVGKICSRGRKRWSSSSYIWFFQHSYLFSIFCAGVYDIFGDASAAAKSLEDFDTSDEPEAVHQISKKRTVLNAITPSAYDEMVFNAIQAGNTSSMTPSIQLTRITIPEQQQQLPTIQAGTVQQEELLQTVQQITNSNIFKAEQDIIEINTDNDESLMVSSIVDVKSFLKQNTPESKSNFFFFFFATMWDI